MYVNIMTIEKFSSLWVANMDLLFSSLTQYHVHVKKKGVMRVRAVQGFFYKSITYKNNNN